MRKITLIVVSLILSSCTFYKKDGIGIHLKNNSNELITNIEFTTSEKVRYVKIDKLEPKEFIQEFLSMRKNESDGTYTLTFYRNKEKKEIISGGYYTNGGSLDHWIDFIIKNDTIIMKFDAPIY